jgi:hypothetical protein
MNCKVGDRPTCHLLIFTSESRLDGGEWAKPEIYKLKHTLKVRVSVRIKFESEILFFLLGVAQRVHMTYGSKLKLMLARKC